MEPDSGRQHHPHANEAHVKSSLNPQLEMTNEASYKDFNVKYSFS